MKYVYCLLISFVLIFLSGCRSSKSATGYSSGYRYDGMSNPRSDQPSSTGFQPVYPSGSGQPVYPSGSGQPVYPSGSDQPVYPSGSEVNVFAYPQTGQTLYSYTLEDTEDVTSQAQPSPQAVDEVSSFIRATMLPKAVIYKTNGDYADHVFVNLSGGRVVSYPAPTDITDNSTPLPVGDGWLLDRRGGVGTNSVFITYTYSQYRALPQVPSPAQLLECIIPSARVTEVRQLPITLQQALADPELVKSYLSEK